MENMEEIVSERENRNRSIFLDTKAKVTAFAKEGLVDSSFANGGVGQSTQPDSDSVLKTAGQKKRQRPRKTSGQGAKDGKKRRKK